jgi:phage repressor protein C with HTH and peptisase S24 domain
MRKIDRFDKYMKVKGLNDNKITVQLGLSIGTLGKSRKEGRDLSDKVVEQILNFYTDLDRVWLLTGEGEMLRGAVVQPSDSASGIPYYSEMPVSAGSADLQLMDGDERAVGYIRIAGVSGKCAFSVVGCSMEPVIHAGDIVVVDVLDRYELIDPDKIYMIVTADDRMIKHIETDESNPDILWCVSPNYRRFSILKTDIRQIFKVTFYGRFV